MRRGPAPLVVIALLFVSLLSLTRGDAARAAAGSDAVVSLAFGPDGGTFAVLRQDGKIALYDARTRDRGRILPTSASSFAFSPDGRQIAAAEGPVVSLWAVDGGSRLDALVRPHVRSNVIVITGYKPEVAFAGNGAIVAVSDPEDGKVFLWNAATGEQMRAIATGPAGPIAFSPDGKLLAVSGEKTIVWRVADGKKVRDLGPASSPRFSRDWKFFVGTMGYYSAQWDAAEGVEIRQFAHSGIPEGITVSADGSVVAVGAWLGRQRGDGAVAIFQAQSGVLIREIKGLDGAQAHVALSPDGRMLATAAEGASEVTFYATLTGQPATLEDALAKRSVADASTAAAAGSPRADEALGTAPVLVAPVSKSDTFTSIAFSRDERWLAVGLKDGSIVVWDVGARLPLRMLAGHSGEVTAVAFSPDATLIASASSDKTVRLWSVVTGNTVRTLTSGSATSLSFSPDGSRLVTGAKSEFHLEATQDDNTVQLWDVATGGLVRRLGGHELEVSSVAFTPDGSFVISGAADGLVKVWDAKTWHEMKSLSAAPDTVEDGRAYPTPVHSVAVSPDGALIAAGTGAFMGGMNAGISVWERSSGRLLRRLTGTPEYVASLAFSPDGKMIASACEFGRFGPLYSHDNAVQLWDVATGGVIDRLPPLSSKAIAFGPLDGILAVVTTYHEIALVDPATGEEVARLGGHTKVASALSFNADGAKLASGGPSPRVWDLATGVGLAYTSSDGLVATLSDDITRVARLGDFGVSVSETATGGTVAEIPSVSATFALSPDGSQLVTAEDNALVFWDAATGAKRGSVSLPGALGVAGTQFLFAPTRDLLLFVPGGKHTRVLVDYRRLAAKTTLPYSVLAMAERSAFSPDGSRLVAVEDNAVRIWSTDDGRLVATLQGGPFWGPVAFSPDGKTVGTGGDLGRLWDAATGRERQTLVGEPGAVGAIAFSPDGALVATGSGRAVRLWRTDTGASVRTLLAHTGAVVALAFAPGGHLLASGGADGRNVLWDVASGAEVVSLFAIDDTDYVTVTPDHYFRSSKGALDKIGFRVGTRVFPFEQFDLQLDRPDKILERLGNPATELVGVYRSLFQKRLKRAGLAEHRLGDDLQLPDVRIARGDIVRKTRARSVTFRVVASTTASDLDHLAVEVNGTPAFGRVGLDLRGRHTRSCQVPVTVDLSPGVNHVTIAAVDARGVESLADRIEIVHEGAAAKPSLFLAAIGVSKYSDARFDLQFASKDASDVASLLAATPGEFGRVFVKRIFDGEATREAILDLRDWLTAAGIDDTVVVFMSGHGLLDDASDYYFATTDVDFAHPRQRGLPYESLESLLEATRARHKVLLMDTCHAGEVDDSPGPGVAPMVTAKAFPKGVVPERPRIGLSNSFDLLEELFADVRRGSGATVIAAASGRGYALESREWNNGVFTYALLDGVRNGTADADINGAITISEVQRYASRVVRELTGGAQTPVARMTNHEADFVLAPSPLLARAMRGAAVSSIAFSPDGTALASTGGESMALWDVATGEERRLVPEPPGHFGLGYAELAYSPDGKTLLVSSGEVPEVRDAQTGVVVPSRYGSAPNGPQYGSRAMSASRDGRWMATAGGSGTVALWDAASGRQLRVLRGHKEAASALAFSPDGDLLATADHDGVVRLWRIPDGAPAGTLSGHVSVVEALAFAPAGLKLASVSQDGTIRLWDATTGKQVRSFGDGERRRFAAAAQFSPDGAVLLTGHNDGAIRFWNVADGAPLRQIRAHLQAVGCLSVSPDGHSLASGGRDGYVRIWRLAELLRR